MNILEVKNLRTHFYTRRGIVKAVDGVSFSVRKGETFGIVGESGCGKTVTSLSILGLVPEPGGKIVAGEIFLEGQDILKKSEKEMRKIRGRHMSMILQDPMTSLNPVFTIGAQLKESFQIHFGLKGKGLLESAKKILEMVQIPSPEVCMRNYPHQLSGGMKQRVVGAISMSCQPKLLIADEPTTSLDATIQVQYLRLLRELQEDTRLTMIFITHDFGIVARMCQEVAVMYAGKIVEMADVRELFNNPMHPYTAALMKSVPKVEEKVEKLFSIEGQIPPLHLLPPGCAFAPRCLSSMNKCRLEEYPPEVKVADGHIVSCWKYN